MNSSVFLCSSSINGKSEDQERYRAEQQTNCESRFLHRISSFADLWLGFIEDVGAMANHLHDYRRKVFELVFLAGNFRREKQPGTSVETTEWRMLLLLSVTQPGQ